VRRTLGGSDCAAADTAASMCRHSRSASSAGKPSTRATVPMTRRMSACVLGSSATTFKPSASNRSLPRLETAASTTSGRSATMASTLGSMPPPTRGNAWIAAGQLE